MKLRHATNVIESNLTENHQFSVEANATLINILSGKIYSDEISAIIREICCNAIDSHIEAGKELTPIDVELPSEMNPHFTVRDYGVGMSEEFVYAVYGIYGKSNKTHTDDLTGALGLGSKSPFAYQEAFSIVSIKDGTKYSFITSMQNGIPYISCVGRSPTTESNGVSIKIPVKNDDIYKFVSKAVDIFSIFQVHPNVTGNRSYSKKELVCKSAYENVYMVDHGHYGSSVSFYAIQANVRYQMNKEKLGMHKELSIVEKLASAMRSDVYVYFDNGTVDFAASREELQYTERTLEAIKNELSVYAETIKNMINKEVQDQPTYWDACRLIAAKNKDFSDLLNSDVAVNISFSSFGGSYTYKGKPVKQTLIPTIDTTKHGLQLYTYAGGYDGWTRSAITRRTGLRVLIETRYHSVLVHNDQKSNFLKRFDLIKEKYDERNLLVVKGEPKKVVALQRLLGGIPIVRTSDVELPVKVKERNAYKHNILLSDSGDNYHGRFEDVEDEYITDPGFYLVAYRNGVQGGAFKDPEIYKPLIDFIKNRSGKKVYYIRQQHEKMLKKYGWKPFDVVLHKIVKELASVEHYSDFFTDNFSNVKYGTNETLRTLFPDVAEKYDLMIRVHEKYGVSSFESYRIIKEYKHSGIISSIGKYDPKEEIENKYPMLKFIDNYDIETYYDDVSEYIKLVDKNQKEEIAIS